MLVCNVLMFIICRWIFYTTQTILNHPYLILNFLRNAYYKVQDWILFVSQNGPILLICDILETVYTWTTHVFTWWIASVSNSDDDKKETITTHAMVPEPVVIDQSALIKLKDDVLTQTAINYIQIWIQINKAQSLPCLEEDETFVLYWSSKDLCTSILKELILIHRGARLRNLLDFMYQDNVCAKSLARSFSILLFIAFDIPRCSDQTNFIENMTITLQTSSNNFSSDYMLANLIDGALVYDFMRQHWT